MCSLAPQLYKSTVMFWKQDGESMCDLNCCALVLLSAGFQRFGLVSRLGNSHGHIEVVINDEDDIRMKPTTRKQCPTLLRNSFSNISNSLSEISQIQLAISLIIAKLIIKRYVEFHMESTYFIMK